MPSREVAGLTLFFNHLDEGAAELIAGACERTAALARYHWGLRLPDECHVHLMTGWLSFVFQSAPWHWRPFLVLTVPFWAPKAARLWPFAGGWALRFGRRRVLGIKPPRLLALGDRRLGAELFVREDNLEKKVQQVACHELIHAHTDHLKLPTWLHEGLAMVTVDLFSGSHTVRHETLDLLRCRGDGADRGRGYPSPARDREGMIRLYAQGYWITRFLSEACCEVLKKVLEKPLRAQELEDALAAALGCVEGSFWRAIPPRDLQRYTDASPRDATHDSAGAERG